MFPLVEGQTLLGDGGRYRFLSRLASGTFAIILKAIDTTAHRIVAIKCIIEPELNAIGEREAALLRALNTRDPSSLVAVVRLVDCFTQCTHFCLVLELLGDTIAHCGTLASLSGRVLPWRQARPPPFLLNDRTGEPQHKLLALVYQRHQHKNHHMHHYSEDAQETQDDDEHEPDHTQDQDRPVALALDEIRQMAVHLCAALAFVHDQGLIHADIKPENIVRVMDVDLLGTSSCSGAGGPLAASVKLVDFGNCIERRQVPLYQADDAADASSGGFDIQTLAFRAPEVAMGVAISPAMDLWSLGCVLVECATGESLFGTGTQDAVELVDQIQWLLAGGVALRTSRPQIYGAARYYQHQVAAQYPAAPSSISVARRLPLRHRLEVSRPQATPLAEWLEFQDFAECLLDIDPSTRLSARAAFVHPFLQRVFPFQFVFAPGLSAVAAGIDTAPPTEQEESGEEDEASDDASNYQENKKPKTRLHDRDEVAKRKRRPHVSSSLKHALQLIPKLAPRPPRPKSVAIKNEPNWM